MWIKVGDDGEQKIINSDLVSCFKVVGRYYRDCQPSPLYSVVAWFQPDNEISLLSNTDKNSANRLCYGIWGAIRQKEHFFDVEWFLAERDCSQCEEPEEPCFE